MWGRFAMRVVLAVIVPSFATATWFGPSMAKDELTQASLIDFETVPNEIPAEGLEISEQFSTTHGIIFSLENGKSPVLAKIGLPRTAFAGPPNNTSADTPASNQNIGSFFLTDDGVLSGLEAEALIITYTPPTAAASGVILDIDFDETSAMFFTYLPIVVSQN